MIPGGGDKAGPLSIDCICCDVVSFEIAIALVCANSNFSDWKQNEGIERDIG